MTDPQPTGFAERLVRNRLTSLKSGSFLKHSVEDEQWQGVGHRMICRAGPSRGCSFCVGAARSDLATLATALRGAASKTSHEHGEGGIPTLIHTLEQCHLVAECPDESPGERSRAILGALKQFDVRNPNLRRRTKKRGSQY